MSDDKQTNEELLEEVKKLRKIEEDRDKKEAFEEKDKEVDFKIGLMIAGGFIIVIVAFVYQMVTKS